jgi:hypothetical protein
MNRFPQSNQCFSAVADSAGGFADGFGTLRTTTTTTTPTDTAHRIPRAHAINAEASMLLPVVVLCAAAAVLAVCSAAAVLCAAVWAAAAAGFGGVGGGKNAGRGAAEAGGPSLSPHPQNPRVTESAT